MKKILVLSTVAMFTFFMGTQGMKAPNENASLFSKLKFAGSLDKAFAGATEVAAGEMAERLWAYVVDSSTSSSQDQSVYEFVKDEIITKVADEMIALGYLTCADIPTSGSELISNGTTTVTYSVGNKTVPVGSNWTNSGSTYAKRLTASVNGNEFVEVQFDCSSDTNIYIKNDFNEFDNIDRVAEFYVQKDSTGRVSLDVQTTCLDPTECGTKENLVISFHSPDGNEVKVIGTSTKDNTTDEVKSISVHAFVSSKIADVHFMDHTDLTNTDDMDPLNATVDEACVDFAQATYTPTNSVTACTSLGASAANVLSAAESDAFGVGNVRPATVNALSVTY